jgi:hypothetical protein
MNDEIQNTDTDDTEYGIQWYIDDTDTDDTDTDTNGWLDIEYYRLNDDTGGMTEYRWPQVKPQKRNTDDTS